MWIPIPYLLDPLQLERGEYRREAANSHKIREHFYDQKFSQRSLEAIRTTQFQKIFPPIED